MLAYATAKLVLALLFPPAVAGIAFFAAYHMMPFTPVAASIILVMGALVLLRYGTMFLGKARR